MDAELENIKDEHIDRFRKAEVFMIERTAEGFMVQHWTKDGVAPQSMYADAYDAAARLLQIMDIKRPVHPQDWPEEVRVSSTE